MKRKNPFPGVTRTSDRHGKIRWRFRRKGREGCYLPGEYGSAEFRAAYEKAVSGSTVVSEPKSPHGTFDWLIELYIRTPDYQRLAPISRKNLSNEIDRFRQAHGRRMVSELRPAHIE